ncbi:MAG TPA: Ig-like domain-containing protein, partial [Terriglobales bacterium]|nr:Ig-like domain-containing protein [Terriglobales bacterium]
AGNPVTGAVDSLGQFLNRFGSDDTSLEGYFELSGLEIPDGSSQASYQITLAPVDPLLSQSVGPYQPWQVQPSGSPHPLTVTINKGTSYQQDILMTGSATDTPDWFGPQTFANPTPVPGNGDWTGTLSGYGNADYFRFSGQANRSMTVEVTALDATGAPSESNMLPVIGMWSLANSDIPAPQATPDAFNTSIFGMSHLNVNLLSSTDFRIGIADYRGDGRPDFRYRARVFYGDSVIPARSSVRGGNALQVRGFGFHSNTQASVGTSSISVLSTSPGQIAITSPANADGPRDITLTDPATGATSVMTGAINYGAGPNDIIKLLAGSNPSTPRGGEAQNPIRIQVLDANGVTPISGATVVFSAVPSVGFSACANATTCTVISDENGEASTRVTALTAGTMTITAQLAPASYSPAKQVQATLFATGSALDISLSSPSVYIAQGATLDIPLSSKVLVNGVGTSARIVNYSITQGTGSLSNTAVSTNTSGIATTTLHLASMTSEVDVSACVGTQNSPCKIFHVFAVPASSLRLVSVAGSLQFAAVTQRFQPVTIRVSDSSGDPVRGADIAFQLFISRDNGGDSSVSIGDTSIQHRPLPVILASSKSFIVSDVNGLASVQPTNAGIPGPIVIQGTASVGIATLPFAAQSFGH